MSDATNAILKQYVKLTEFLGLTLGPDYEVALHDLTDKNRSIIAIANGHVSGRSVGAPLTNMALSILKDKSYESTDYRLHSYGVAVNGKDLRSSTMFIKHEGRLIGMLSINFDDSRYRAVSESLLELCHPDAFVSEVVNVPAEPSADEVQARRPEPVKFPDSTAAVVADSIKRELDEMGVPSDRISAEEKIRIIASLDNAGIFLLKGAVGEAARKLGCSQASVYRYLSKIRQSGTGQ